MTEAQMDEFFRARRVAVLSIARDGKPPLTAPIWYEWNGRVFHMHVDAKGAKAKLIGRLGRAPVALAIQSEVPPYRYVVVYGSATLSTEVDPAQRLRVARRYFGRRAGDMYVQREQQRGSRPEDMRTVEVTPERTVSHDFGPEAGWFGRLYFAVMRLFRPVPA